MNMIQKLKNRLFPDIRPLPAGAYYSIPSPEEHDAYRLHLRLEPDGTGLLIVNASTILHLNQTAAEYAYHMVHKTQDEVVGKTIAERYQTSHEQAEADYHDFRDRLDSLVNTPDLDPVTFLDFDRAERYSDLTAPLRLDCALTYQLTDPGLGAALLERVTRDLGVSDWKLILSKAWAAGIPHVVFTGGEPTLHPDLVALIQHAQEIGMVSGLLTDGIRLADPTYLDELLQSGLDHAMILLDPGSLLCWDSIQRVIAEDLFLTVHLTIGKSTSPKVEKVLQFIEDLGHMGVRSLSLSEDDPELKPVMDAARQKAAELDITLVWDLPVPYSQYNPVALELAGHGEDLTGSGKAWVYVEPDGDVLPAQGVNKVLGNLLTDEWPSIWKSI